MTLTTNRLHKPRIGKTRTYTQSFEVLRRGCLTFGHFSVDGDPIPTVLRLNSTTRAQPDPTGPARTRTDPRGLCRRPARTQRSFSETRAAKKVRAGPCGSCRVRVVEFSYYHSRKCQSLLHVKSLITAQRRETPHENAQSHAKREKCADTTRAVLTNGHTGHVSKAPGFFFLFEGPQLAVVKYF